MQSVARNFDQLLELCGHDFNSTLAAVREGQKTGYEWVCQGEDAG